MVTTNDRFISTCRHLAAKFQQLAYTPIFQGFSIQLELMIPLPYDVTGSTKSKMGPNPEVMKYRLVDKLAMIFQR